MPTENPVIWFLGRFLGLWIRFSPRRCGIIRTPFPLWAPITR